MAKAIQRSNSESQEIQENVFWWKFWSVINSALHLSSLWIYKQSCYIIYIMLKHLHLGGWCYFPEFLVFDITTEYLLKMEKLQWKLEISEEGIIWWNRDVHFRQSELVTDPSLLASISYQYKVSSPQARSSFHNICTYRNTEQEQRRIQNTFTF